MSQLAMGTRPIVARYGRKYLDETQWAQQEATLNAETIGATTYGPKYRADDVPVTTSAPLPATTPGLLTIRDLTVAMAPGTVTADTFAQAFAAESNRPEGPRKVALTILEKAAKEVGETVKAEALQKAIAALG